MNPALRLGSWHPGALSVCLSTHTALTGPTWPPAEPQHARVRCSLADFFSPSLISSMNWFTILTKNLPRNQKGKNSEESLKLVGNLGTDFRNCGQVPQEQKKKGGGRRGRKPTHLTPPFSVMKGQKLKSRDPGACAQEAPRRSLL